MAKRHGKPAPQITPAVDPQDVFSKAELEAVVRFMRRKVIIHAVVRVETAEADVQRLAALAQMAKQIEQLAVQELVKLG